MSFFLSKVELKKQLRGMGIKVEGNYVRKNDLHEMLAIKTVDEEYVIDLIYTALRQFNSPKINDVTTEDNHGGTQIILTCDAGGDYLEFAISKEGVTYLGLSEKED